jgi:hypothetical protein
MSRVQTILLAAAKATFKFTTKSAYLQSQFARYEKVHEWDGVISQSGTHTNQVVFTELMKLKT